MDKRGSHNPAKALMAVALALVMGLLVRTWNDSGAQSGARPDTRYLYDTRPVAPRGELTPAEVNSTAVFANVSPSVVFITNTSLQQDIFTMSVYETPRGSGSGFVWDIQGHILTNYHVIVDANRVEVTLSDGSKWKASLVGVAREKDVAVLKIDAPAAKLRPIPVGDSANLKVGQTVYAIGNPFGVGQTMTSGIVSALNREIQSLSDRTIQGVIQSDAAINPGNSGGPLLDSAGRLIGINTQIVSPSGASAGVGFSVPVEMVNQVASQIIKYGKVIRPGLGVSIVREDLTRRLGLDGILIRETIPGSGAENAGLKGSYVRGGQIILGDLIKSIDGKPVHTFDDLGTVLDQHRVGDTVTVEVFRGGANKKVAVELMEMQ
ncbi:MAG: trypsin-like peptidase domain-containing protein [Nitrospinota bacterium]|nr:trypsin-like peptidase domain-containing protein [Nitrospinota bacterium]